MALSVTPAIPASQIVSVEPSVLGAGGSALVMNGVILTTTARPPIGQVLSFATAADVSTYFGATSQEASLATIYFLGPNNKTQTPDSLLMAQYPLTAVPAFLRGGSVSSMTVTQLQALNQSLSITIDGTLDSATINLAAATSFSSAALLIANGLGIHGAQAATINGSISGNTLTVGTLTTGTIAVGQVLSGTGVVTNTYISALGTGTGGVGTYTVQGSQVAASQNITLYTGAVSYDSVSGGFLVTGSVSGTAGSITYASGSLAVSLKLTQGSGAVISQGAAATDPTTFMNSFIAITQNWASFMTTWEPSDSDKEAFALWNNGQNNRYIYAMWDTSILDTQTNGPSPPVAYLATSDISGTCAIYEDPTIDTVGAELAAFVLGWVASLDFNRLNGRATLAFKGQTGLTPQVTNATIASNLIANGLNFYGDYTTANDSFNWLYPGSVSGPFLWLDSYANQIWLNQNIQLAIMSLLDSVGSIPYNQAGYSLIAAAVQDPINAGVNFGAIRAGVQLSASQIAQVNAAAGLTIDTILFQRGWYFQVIPASAAVRAARQSPTCTLWYVDGQAVQSVTIASVEIQ